MQANSSVVGHLLPKAQWRLVRLSRGFFQSMELGYVFPNQARAAGTGIGYFDDNHPIGQPPPRVEVTSKISGGISSPALA